MNEKDLHQPELPMEGMVPGFEDIDWPGSIPAGMRQAVYGHMIREGFTNPLEALRQMQIDESKRDGNWFDR